MENWIVYGLLAVLLGLVFFFYLLVRRTVTEFKDGMRDRQR